MGDIFQEIGGIHSWNLFMPLYLWGSLSQWLRAKNTHRFKTCLFPCLAIRTWPSLQALWPLYLTEAYCYHGIYCIVLLWGFTALLHVKSLALAHSKWTIKVSYYYYYIYATIQKSWLSQSASELRDNLCIGWGNATSLKDQSQPLG